MIYNLNLTLPSATYFFSRKKVGKILGQSQATRITGTRSHMIVHSLTALKSILTLEQ